MFVKAQSKQRFGDSKTPFLNVAMIATIELGHDGNVNAKMSNGEEFVVAGEHAKMLIQLVEKDVLH